MNNEISTSNFPMDFPILILENIFLHIPGEYLCKNHCLVSKKWNKLIECNSLWLKKCRKESKINNDLKNSLDKRFTNYAKKLYFNKLYITNNLLKNPDGKELLKDWWFNYSSNSNAFNSYQYYFPKNLVHNFSFNISEVINKYKELKDKHLDTNTKWATYMSIVDRDSQFAFVTTYSLGEKIQVIDLNDYDLEISLLNSLLKLEICEYYSSRNTFKYIYFLRVYLISKDFEVMDTFKHEYVCRNDEYPLKWNKISHMFNLSKFKKSVRFILYYHAGQVSLNLTN